MSFGTITRSRPSTNIAPTKIPNQSQGAGCQVVLKPRSTILSFCAICLAIASVLEVKLKCEAATVGIFWTKAFVKILSGAGICFCGETILLALLLGSEAHATASDCLDLGYKQTACTLS